MFDRVGILFLPKKTLAKPRMRLPSVRIFREIVSPKRFFVVKDLRPLPCANSHHSDRQNANHGDRSLKFAAPAIGKHRHACANKRDERNVGKILKMIRDQRPTAQVSHSNEPNHWQERNHKISDGNKTAAQTAVSEKTKAGRSAKPAQSTAATPTDLANRSANADRSPSDALAEKLCPRTTKPPFPRLRNGAQPNRL